MTGLIIRDFLVIANQLWKLSDDMILLNGNGNWKYSNQIFILPRNGEVSLIRDFRTEKLLTIDNPNDLDPNVILYEAIPLFEEDEFKYWYKSMPDQNGWFILKHQPSGKVLTASDTTSLVLTGMLPFFTFFNRHTLKFLSFN